MNKTDRDTPPKRPVHVAHETASCVIVESRRAVAPLNGAMLQAHAYAAATNRSLVLVSAANTRATYPLLLLLAQPDVQWVIDGSGLVRDGISGQAVNWDGERYGLVGGNPRPRPPTPGTPGFLTIEMRAQWQAGHGPSIGHTAEAVTGALLTEMSGWGLSEPTGRPWQPRAMDEFAANHADSRISLVVTGKGGGLAGIIDVQTSNGLVQERTRLASGFNREPGLDVAEKVVRAASGTQTTLSGVVMWHTGHPDATRSPVPTPPGLPMGLLTTDETTDAAQRIGLEPVDLGGGRYWVPFGLSPHRELASLALDAEL